MRVHESQTDHEAFLDRASQHVRRVAAHALERSAVRRRAHGAAGVRRAGWRSRVLVLFVRAMLGTRAGRTHVALPALLPVMRRSPLALARHLPLLLFLAGLPFFGIALADPHTGFTREEVSYPGRRIALLVDASTSMVMQFKTQTMKTQGEATFFTAVAGAEQFIRRRMNGPYRDLVALIQFGNQAYVVTPFTTDYENILLSIRLVSDPREWGRFSDWGTTIIEGIDQATQLFKTFAFVNASGNLMIVFTDGRDSELQPKGRPRREPGRRGAHAGRFRCT